MTKQMIKFFRKIRQNLLMDLSAGKAGNKTSKYFKYAIGEIVLVVIGILIALQINNWNEKRLDKLKSKDYLERIIEDLDLKINSFESEMKRGDRVKKHLMATVKILQSGTMTKDQKDTLDFTFSNYFQFVRIEGTLNTVQEMKSSGDLGLIYSKELRKSINSYLRYLIAISKIFDQLSNKVNDDHFMNNYITLNMKENFSESTLSYDFTKLCKDQFVINKLSRFTEHWSDKKSFSEILANNSEKLKEEIQKELLK
tara:strand:- start:4946 stop:5710 length:765 start_codon:yes stop_codon:yes gene_type:complete